MKQTTAGPNRKRAGSSDAAQGRSQGLPSKVVPGATGPVVSDVAVKAVASGKNEGVGNGSNGDDGGGGNGSGGTH